MRDVSLEVSSCLLLCSDISRCSGTDSRHWGIRALLDTLAPRVLLTFPPSPSSATQVAQPLHTNQGTKERQNIQDKEVAGFHLVVLWNRVETVKRGQKHWLILKDNIGEIWSLRIVSMPVTYRLIKKSRIVSPIPVETTLNNVLIRWNISQLS